jgi:hypothetical protein
MHRHLSVVCALGAVAATAWIAGAGSLNPAGAPAPTMRTLNEIYAAATDDPVFVSEYPSFSAEDLLYNRPASAGSVFFEVDGVVGGSVVAQYEGWMDVLASQQDFATDTRGKAIVGRLRLLVQMDAAMADLITLLRSQQGRQMTVEWTANTQLGRVPTARLQMDGAIIPCIRPTPESRTYEVFLTFDQAEYFVWTLDGIGTQTRERMVALP